MSFREIEIKPISGSTGAEVKGVDLAGELPLRIIEEIRIALLEHLVLFFRNQILTPEQYIAAARCFGTLHVHEYLNGLSGYPEIHEIRKEPWHTQNFGGIWHSDSSYLKAPPLGSMLYAKEVPNFGGDTIWANQYMAYETLSDGMKSLLADLVAIHSSNIVYGGMPRRSMEKETGAVTFEAEHPVIRVHPKSRRNSLFVNRVSTVRFKGFTEQESSPLLNLLMTHATNEKFTYRHRWKKHDVAFWDNLCTMHLALNDYDGKLRVMHRVTLKDENYY